MVDDLNVRDPNRLMQALTMDRRSKLADVHAMKDAWPVPYTVTGAL